MASGVWTLIGRNFCRVDDNFATGSNLVMTVSTDECGKFDNTGDVQDAYRRDAEPPMTQNRGRIMRHGPRRSGEKKKKKHTHAYKHTHARAPAPREIFTRSVPCRLAGLLRLVRVGAWPAVRRRTRIHSSRPAAATTAAAAFASVMRCTYYYLYTSTHAYRVTYNLPAKCTRAEIVYYYYSRTRGHAASAATYCIAPSGKLFSSFLSIIIIIINNRPPPPPPPPCRPYITYRRNNIRTKLYKSRAVYRPRINIVVFIRSARSLFYPSARRYRRRTGS